MSRRKNRTLSDSKGNPKEMKYEYANEIIQLPTYYDLGKGKACFVPKGKMRKIDLKNSK